MKTNKSVLTGIGFILGIICGISIMALVSFTKDTNNSNNRDGAILISSAQAKTYFQNYMGSAEKFNDIIKGFMVDKAELSAMNLIANENPNLTSFRIYNGKDNNSAKIGIVVGVDSKGRDAVNNSIYNTDSALCDPCPTVCDLNSAIINNN